MKLLIFEIKRNLTKSPRIYVKSNSTKDVYGSFHANEPDNFDGWNKMNNLEKVEFKNYINNLQAVQRHLGAQYLDELLDYRLRLPSSLENAIDEISLIYHRASKDFDIYEPIVSAIIQTLKIAITKLEDKEDKAKGLKVLDKLDLAEYKKLDYSREVQAIFAEIIPIYNKSEKLHQKALTLFDKDKSYSPKAIDAMASGNTNPAKWLASCAIAMLLEEKPKVLNSFLTEDDIYMLFAKPLLDNDRASILSKLITKHKLEFLKNKL